MTGACVVIKGLDDIRRKLTDMPELFDNEILAALDCGAALIEGEAKENCPVDTGRLRGSITTDEGKKDESGKFVVLVGTNVEYASYVEYGTGLYSEFGAKWSGRGSFGQPAQPFLRPAYNSHRQAAIDAVRDYLEDVVERNR